MEVRKEIKIPATAVELTSILIFCKNAYAAKHARPMSAEQEYIVKKTLKNIEKQLENPERRQIIIDYIATLLPMAKSKHLEKDVITLTDVFSKPIRLKGHKPYFGFFTKFMLTPAVLLEEKKQKTQIEVFAADALSKAKNYLYDDGDCVMVANKAIETPKKLFKNKRLAPTKILFFIQIEGQIHDFELAIWEHGWTTNLNKKILSYAPLHKETVPEFINVLSELYNGQIRACNLILPSDSEKTQDPNYMDFIGVKDHFRRQKSQESTLRQLVL
ncbi:MAG: hypothetical protein ACYCQI_08435 [Gammaproteobacteria bacterium]